MAIVRELSDKQYPTLEIYLDQSKLFNIKVKMIYIVFDLENNHLIRIQRQLNLEQNYSSQNKSSMRDYFLHLFQLKLIISIQGIGVAVCTGLSSSGKIYCKRYYILFLKLTLT